MSNVRRVLGTTLAALAIATAVAPAAGAVTVTPQSHNSTHVTIQPDRRCHHGWVLFHRHCRRH